MAWLTDWLRGAGDQPPAAMDRFVHLLLLIDLILLVASAAVAKAGAGIVAAAAILAASTVGGLIGLLFAVPKRDPTWQRPDGEPGSAYRPNSSLEDVSDWLTKTIIGAGLVSLSAGLTRLDEAGGWVGRAVFGVKSSAALPGGVSMLLAATSIGGLASYLWFYRLLPDEFAKAFEAAGKRSVAGLGQRRDGPHPESLAAVGHKAEALTADDAPTLADAINVKYLQLVTKPIRADDWCKGMFGGQSRVRSTFGERSLEATIGTAKDGGFLVEIVLRAIDGQLPSQVIFFLHNTFPQTTPIVSFGTDRVARLGISAWGAFTIGAITDDGTTELELDLAAVPGAPARFRAQ